MNWIDAVQWPAMLATIVASWLVASSQKKRRHAGFWIFLVSNVMWVAWGWHANAYALVVLQFCLAATNLRGEKKTESAASG